MTSKEENSNLSPGYAFYKKIGSPKKIVAPMVDQSELAFRMLTRKYGADLVYTQMFSANCFAESETYRQQNFQTCPEDRPLVVQLMGHKVDTLLTTAKMVQKDCDAVDLNLGCPQGIAKRGRYGAYLMEELELLEEIVSTLTENLDIPVLCKSRIYKNDLPRTIKLYETLINAGAKMITVHGRTRDEKGYLVAEVDWITIRQLVTYFNHKVPIIANGGIETIDDYYKCLEITGADGVMSAEGILENPMLWASTVPGGCDDFLVEYRRDFSDLIPTKSNELSDVVNILQKKNIKTTQDMYFQIIIAKEYLKHCRLYSYQAIRMVKSHLMKILYRYIKVHRGIRDVIVHAVTLDEFDSVIDMCTAMIDGLRSGFNTTDVDAAALSTKVKSTKDSNDVQYDEHGNALCDATDIFNFYDVNWYRRHRTPIEDISIYPGRMPTPSEHNTKAMQHRNSSEFFGNMKVNKQIDEDHHAETGQEVCVDKQGEGDFFGNMFA